MPKPHPERVDPSIACFALSEAEVRLQLWTAYILRHYYVTGDLAPGCDLRDLIAWCEANAPLALAELTRRGAPKGKKRKGAT